MEGQLDFFGMNTSSPEAASRVELPDVPEFTAVERMQMERETTGLYLSGHPMGDYRAAAKRLGAVPIGEITEDFAGEEGASRFADGQVVTVAGIVASSRTRTTKTNTLMAYVMLEDETSSIELLCFQKVIDRCGSYILPNLAVVVRGRISARDEKPPQILCDELYPLEDADKVGGIPGVKRVWMRAWCCISAYPVWTAVRSGICSWCPPCLRERHR